MPLAGLLFYRGFSLPGEPLEKRVYAFIDGQNLFHQAKEAFGYTYPNYDPLRLAQAVCQNAGWRLTATHFYTGLPSAMDNPNWHRFWSAKMAVMGTRGVKTFGRELRYRNQAVRLPDGTRHTLLVSQEKGIDVRIALDVVRFALDDAYDVALLFSQDQDLTEAVADVKRISRLQQRWIKVACAFPVSPVTSNRRGINGTDWIRLDRTTYDACVDPNRYLPEVNP